MPDVRLLASGQEFGGWQGIRIQRGMEQCANTFELVVSELWPGQDYVRRIVPGDACSLSIDGETIITGYVDEAQISYSATKHEVHVAGRDKTADLVDCSAVAKAGQWRNQKMERIAQDLADPFGVKVRADVDTGKAFPTFALQEGESVFEAIERMARIRAVLLVSDGQGGLRITRAGVERVSQALERGVNILEASASLNLRDRYSKYTMKGQAAGSNFFSGSAAAHIMATETDPNVLRYRPLILIGEAQDAAASLKDRVKWEANVRAARSTDVSITVQGWTHSGGVLWKPNTLVKVVDEWLRIDGDELLIKGVVFALTNEGGTTAQLSLTRADAFTLLPLKMPPGPETFWALPKPEKAATP